MGEAARLALMAGIVGLPATCVVPCVRTSSKARQARVSYVLSKKY